MACKPMSTVVLPPPFLIWTLKNKLIWKLVRDYASIYVKFINCHQRVKFLRVCLEKEIIPNFLRFTVPENGVFSNQAVHSFQTKLLRTEINKARTDEKNVEVKLERARGAVQRGVDEKYWPSGIKYLSLRGQKQTVTVKETHQKKLMKLSERQDRSPGKQGEGSVRAHDDVELPDWVQQVLALGPKHSFRDKFNETLFLADIDIFLSDLKNRKVPGEALCEIEAVAKTYAKRVKQTPTDKGVEKARKYLKSNGLVAVPYDKGVGFCVMRNDTYENKLSYTLDSNQCSKSKGTSDAIVLKIERDINKKLLAMRKKDEIRESLYTRMRSTGGQPARLYGLTKVHKVNTPLRPVLSLPGSSYYNLNKVLAKFFEKIEGANIETNSLDAREILESTNLEPNENLISLDVKSLYRNFPLKEAIDIALRKLYEQDEPPSIARKTMKRLLNRAVSQVHFKCNETWYVQKDGLAMGASLAVILANLWVKQFETALARDFPQMFLPEKDLHGMCPECNKEATYRSKGVECECCLNWYHVKCGDISDDEYRNISETVCYCRKCASQ